MLEHRSVDFKMFSVPFTHSRNYIPCVAIVTSWSWMGLWRHCWRKQWLGRVHCTDWEWDLCMEYPLRLTFYFVQGVKFLLFSYFFLFSGLFPICPFFSPIPPIFPIFHGVFFIKKNKMTYCKICHHNRACDEGCTKLPLVNLNEYIFSRFIL